GATREKASQMTEASPKAEGCSLGATAGQQTTGETGSGENGN
ncbi:unnamed protein product, partial [marine sediment metagenome]